MEFLGIGYQEVLLVLVLMLVVVGPQRMPQVAYQIGRAVREMQKYARAVRDEFSDEWQYLDSQAKEIRGEMDSASRDLADVRRSLRAETDKMDQELKAASAEVEATLPAVKPSTAGRAPSPLPNSNAAAKPTRAGATISTNGGAPKPLTLKAKEPAVANVDETAKTDDVPTQDEPARQTASTPPLVF